MAYTHHMERHWKRQGVNKIHKGIQIEERLEFQEGRGGSNQKSSWLGYKYILLLICVTIFLSVKSTVIIEL